jgi:tRNA-Thr(GGU) m(6)t(6)A37 methyltransferase TsaA
MMNFYLNMSYKIPMEILYTAIGLMHCELFDSDTAPKFYTESTIKGTIEIFEEYKEGLAGLNEYDHIMVFFHFHRSSGYSLMQKRRGEGELRGVFSLCSPNRPNGIGMSVLKLIKVQGNILHVENVDLLDNTPILDIKPYKPMDYPSGTKD